MGKRVRMVLMAALALVFLVSTGMVARELVISMREKRANAALVEQVHAAQAETGTAPRAVSREEINLPTAETGETAKDTSAPSAGEITEPDKGVAEEETVTIIPQYVQLWEMNGDLAGWLTVEGTKIDYPVMYTPEDQDYYLRRSFDGSDARSGSLFIAVPWTQGHTLIYGHNMKDDAMFGTLLRYQNAAFAAEHPTIRFDTLVEEGEYEVLAAFQSKAAKWSSEGIFPYWMYTDLSDEETFDAYVQAVKGLSLYDTGVTAEFGDELLTLSTCDYYTTQGRFVVVAKKIIESQ